MTSTPIHRFPAQRLALFTAVGLLALALGGYAIHANDERDDSQDQPPQAAAPDVIAIDFYADWCGFCQQMADDREQIREQLAEQPVLFLTFDHTTEHDVQKSAYHAGMLGLDDIWSTHGGKTGRMIVIDPETGQQIAKLNHENDLDDMKSTITANFQERP